MQLCAAPAKAFVPLSLSLTRVRRERARAPPTVGRAAPVTGLPLAQRPCSRDSFVR